ncbi:MAG: ion transporter [Gammaproteobacteria bacterium]|nr:ion transporter [Gammaproteobacteria bacterium]
MRSSPVCERTTTGNATATLKSDRELNSTPTISRQHRPSSENSLRHTVFRVLETANGNDRLSRAVDISIVALICASVVAVVLESIATLETEYADWFYWFEVVTVSVFSVEYFCRVWSSVEKENRNHSDSSFIVRLRFVFSFHAMIDVIAILPFYLLTFGLTGGFDMRFLRAVRLLRVLKLTRYSSALNMLFTTISENGRSLGASFFILMTVMLLASSGIYYFERESQPVDFGNIPAAMWWAFATLTTVGYGDVTPITAGGKVFGALITVVGVGMVALPTGILASGFAQQLRLRSDQYQSKADLALDDGVLTDTEISDLETLRLQLGLGKNTASQILDVQKVQKMLESEHEKYCPHCGSPVSRSRDV